MILGRLADACKLILHQHNTRDKAVYTDSCQHVVMDCLLDIYGEGS